MKDSRISQNPLSITARDKGVSAVKAVKSRVKANQSVSIKRERKRERDALKVSHLLAITAVYFFMFHWNC
jgi:HD superfamily phosphodiesterase